jgi:hypothetical protein
MLAVPDAAVILNYFLLAGCKLKRIHSSDALKLPNND